MFRGRGTDSLVQHRYKPLVVPNLSIDVETPWVLTDCLQVLVSCLLGWLRVVLVLWVARRTTEALGAVLSDAEQQRLSCGHLVVHNSVELLQVRCGEPGFLVVVYYQYPKGSGTGHIRKIGDDLPQEVCFQKKS